MFTRKRALPPASEYSFFLWGARQTGKSTLLRSCYPSAFWVDLLHSGQFRLYATRPEVLRQEVEAHGATQVVIDEIQKVPGLLDEVHWLMENRGVRFALCGSSARKVRRGHANLLGGRAIRHELLGLSAAEIGSDWDLVRMLNNGYLPSFYGSSRPRQRLNAYVSDYLKEEVVAEGLVRNLPAFSDFLEVAALSDAELVNANNIARECGVSAHTVRAYFGILEDSLLARWLPSYRRRPKRRVIQAPKFYFNDVGLVNLLAKRGQLEPGSQLFGKAFENWVFHELSAYVEYTDSLKDLSYWRLASGIEVDFVVDQMRVAIEAKASTRVLSQHLKGLRHLLQDHPEVQRRVVVSLVPRRRRTEDAIEILSARDFVELLWSGELF